MTKLGVFWGNSKANNVGKHWLNNSYPEDGGSLVANCDAIALIESPLICATQFGPRGDAPETQVPPSAHSRACHNTKQICRNALSSGDIATKTGRFGNIFNVFF
jgi:hypothetical protein